jgi:hypothetical protein
VAWIWSVYRYSKLETIASARFQLCHNRYLFLFLCRYRKCDLDFGETDQSVLVKLLQQSGGLPKMAGPPPTTFDSLPLLLKGTTNMAPTSVYREQAQKRCSMGPADDSNPKRMKAPTLKMPNSGPLATRVTPLKPSRGATSSLMDLLTERPTGHSQQPLSNQTSSVLQNLLVSGHDLQTGHDLQKRHSSCKAVTSSCFVSLLPSSPRLSLEKVFFSPLSLSSSVVCFRFH